MGPSSEGPWPPCPRFSSFPTSACRRQQNPGAPFGVSVSPCSELGHVRCPRCWRWVPSAVGAAIAVCLPQYAPRPSSPSAVPSAKSPRLPTWIRQRKQTVQKKQPVAETRRAPKAAPAPTARPNVPTMEKPSKTALRDGASPLVSDQAGRLQPGPGARHRQTVAAKAESTAKSSKVVAKPSAAAPDRGLSKAGPGPDRVKAARPSPTSSGFDPKRTKAADVVEERSVPKSARLPASS